MAFQIKDFRSIVASMVNVMRANTRKITDFNVGSVVRTMLEAIGIEMDQLYQEMFHGLKEAIPVATYTSFNFELLQSSAAKGRLTFYAVGGHTEGILIPAGTLAKNPVTGRTYQTTQDVTLLVGASDISSPAVATIAAADTNCDAGSATDLVTPIQGVAGVSNLVPFTGGSDKESEESRKLRFQAFISTLNRGTNSALRYGAGTAAVVDVNGLVTERAILVEIIEPYLVDPVLNAPGFVEIHVHNGVGLTSQALIDEVQKVIDGYYDANGAPVPGWKAAGVVVSCMAAIEVDVDVTGVITALPGYQIGDLLAAADQVVASYILSLGIGRAVVAAEIVERVMSVAGVYNFVLSAPSTDLVPVAASEKAMPGTITITAA